MIRSKLKKNAKKIDKFLIEFLKKQKKSLLVSPMKYSVISGGKKYVLQLFSILEKFLILGKKNF